MLQRIVEICKKGKSWMKWRKEEERKTFSLTFGDKHSEITAMAFQLSQIIFRNELTNCKGALQFPLLIIYLS